MQFLRNSRRIARRGLAALLLAGGLIAARMPAQAQYARFSRPTDTIQVNGNTALTGAFTFEARVMLTVRDYGWVFRESANSEDKYLQIGQLNLTGRAVGLGNADALGASLPIVLRRWHHIAFVYDGGSQLSLYLDGQRVSYYGSSYSNPNDNFGRFQIGAWDGSNSFIGYMDTIRISNIARYGGNSFVPPTGDLPADDYTQLLYNFNEPVGSTTVTDLGILGNDGTFGTGFSGATSPEIVATVPEAGSVTGIVRLVGANDAAQKLVFEFRPVGGGTVIRREQVVVPTGIDTASYYQSGIPAGTYDIAIKGHAWLRRVIPGVVIANSTTAPPAQLMPGDLNGDNSVDALDLAWLIDSFNLEGAP